MRGDDLQGVIKLSVGVLCAAAFVLILIILSGSELDDTSAKAIGTAVALAFLSLTAVAGSHLTLRQPQLSLLGFATIAISGLAFLATAAAIWSDFDGDGWKSAGSCLILAFAGGHTCVLLSGAGERDGDGIKAVRYGTIAALWLLATLAIAELSSSGDDVDPQGLGVVAVLYALGTVLLPLLRRTAPAAAGDPAPPPGPGPGPRPGRGDELQVDHVCLVWPGSAESAVEALAGSGAQVLEGPVPRNGARGAGRSVYYREPDGSLVELIAYR
ncbi:MAG TPA: hypothetical protein VFN92_13600 [Solirubrobacterales bacterium]|nr:hypothetical protein [Solirubrobacterales bacterium]